MSKNKLDKNVFVLGWVSLFTDISSQMIYPLLPIFLSSVLGVSTVFIGLLEGIAESTASILKVFSGWFSDRVKKRKPIIFWGYGLSTIGKPFLYLASAGWHVLLIRFVDRVGKGIRASPRDALIADSSAAEQRGRAFGIQRAMDNLGAFLGPLLAFLILPVINNDVRGLFLLSFFPGIIAVAIIFIFLKEKPHAAGQPKKINIFSLKQFNREFKLFIFIVAVFSLGKSSEAFLIIRAKDLGVPVVFIPMLWLVYNFVSSFVSAPLGHLSDKIGRRKTSLIGFFIYSLVYFGFAFARSPSHIWVLMAVYGLYYGLSEGVLSAYVADLVEDKSILATAYGTYHMVIGLCAFPASFIMGLLCSRSNFSIAFSYGAVLSLLAALMLAILLRDKGKKPMAIVL